MTSFSTYWHTLRYLKPVQLYGRVWFKLARPQVDEKPPPRLRPLTRSWVVPAQRNPSLRGPDFFCFLNETRHLSECGWDNPAVEKLWRYNLHYFDDLNAADSKERTEWHYSLLRRWVQENDAAAGTGWEPYPTSLRIVNWIKWTLSGYQLPLECVYSLAVQVRWLTKRLEYHLLGNHLFANAKALVYAGTVFEGDEADDWLRRGMTILSREVPRQILADGGHFERSTMYHALAFEDILDLVNLANAYPQIFSPWQRFCDGLKELATNVGRWLAALCQPDGEISFFNDAAIGIAPAPMSLFQYARRLGIFVDTDFSGGPVWLKDSGYVRAECGGAVLIADVAKIGPDYLPAHSHADTLSFELSVAGRRVLVNSGTSQYGSGPQRQKERATAAHNTIEVDGQNSSEVWAGFRVAKRARPFGVEVDAAPQSIVIQAAHDGYRRLPGRPVHRRRWVMSEHALEIEDSVDGCGDHVVNIFFHFYPGLRLSQMGLSTFIVERDDGKAILNICLDEKLVCNAEPGAWHPQFGMAKENVCVRGDHRGSLPVRLLTRLIWRI